MDSEPETADRRFELRFEAETDILHMRLHGFWTLGTLAAYTARLLAEAARLGLRRRAFDILSDSRTFAVQSAEVTQGFNGLSRKAASLHKGRTAIVVASRLNKIQAERALGGGRTRVFLDIDEAREWLMTERLRDAA